MSITTRNRFFFHIQEGDVLLLDDVGQACPTLQDAELEAAVTGASLLRDAAARGVYEPISVEVTNAAGETCVTIQASMRVQRVL
jgi:hypothetical protein